LISFSFNGADRSLELADVNTVFVLFFLPDLVDMIESMKLTDEEIKKKVEWVEEKIKLEQKVSEKI